jgi:hypothetical protein
MCSAILLLELVIMPSYVYRPPSPHARSRSGDASRRSRAEMIPPEDILGDEIGQIMRSRNVTVGELRRHEDELEAALAASKNRIGWLVSECFLHPSPTN